MKATRAKNAGIEAKPARVWLWGILGAAVLLRLAYLLELRRTPFFDHLLLDLSSYDAWAQKLAGGEWLGTRVFYQDPLYPYFLGFLYSVVGHRLVVVYLLQLMLGTFTCYLVYCLGKSLFSSPVALLAAALAAFYKPFIFYDIQIEKSFLAVLLVTAACVMLVRAGAQGNAGTIWVGAGVLLGLVILIRGNYLLLLPLILLGILFLNPGQRRGRAAVHYGLGACLILVLTCSRNYIVGRDPVLTTSQAGQNFYIGNNPENLTGMYRAPDFVRGDPKYEEVDFAREAERQSGRPLRPSEISSFWMKRGFDFLLENPGRSLLLIAQKTALFWNAYEIPDNLDMYFFEQYSKIMRLWLPAFGIVAPLGILGMILCLLDWNRLWAIYLFVLGYFASVILFYVFSRYRLPVVSFLMVFGAQALVRLYGYVRVRNYRSLSCAAAILLVAGIGVNFPLGSTYNPSAIDNLGAILLQTGDLDTAESLFRQVIAHNPEFADARANLAVALMRKGDVTAATAELREVVRLKPRRAGGYVNLGNALLSRGDTQGASESLKQALQLDPESPEAWQGLGEVQRQQGNLSAAAESFRHSIAINPDSANAHNDLAITLLALGNLDEALHELQEATRLDPALARAWFNQGICLERLHRTEEAAAAYRHAISVARGFAEAYGNLAAMLADSGDRKGAIECYQRFLEHWKGDAKVRQAVEDEIRKLR
jgi:Flp pilus assembly protein TadD/4-amino-4-deoxy-L-arabinose transferase-like glycosyltransferase